MDRIEKYERFTHEDLFKPKVRELIKSIVTKYDYKVKYHIHITTKNMLETKRELNRITDFKLSHLYTTCNLNISEL